MIEFVLRNGKYILIDTWQNDKELETANSKDDAIKRCHELNMEMYGLDFYFDGDDVNGAEK